MMGNINQAIELIESSSIYFIITEGNETLYFMLIALYFNECFYKNKDETQYKQLVNKVYDLEEISKSWNM